MKKCLLTVYVSCTLLQLVVKLCYAVTYTDQWAVHVEGGEQAAKNIADKHGFTYLGQILPDFYHFHHRRVSKRSTFPSSHIHDPLTQDPMVKWAEQQVAKKRVKRDLQFSDPKWPRMWYMNRGQGLDMNVKTAWERGITGKGVVVSILDDGIERDHPDLKVNYDPDASYDVNGHDFDPTPRYDYTNENRHGTRCAGEVAAEANNGICSVGVAYDASIGGVRMLDGDVTDAVEARSLSHNPQHIDIYSASWGPDDDGQTVDGPAPLAKKAFEEGIKNVWFGDDITKGTGTPYWEGRKGKGSIFVWASGNGGRDGDSCNCDGYTNSIYTLSISSATERGDIPWYSEACSSTLATTYSSGSGGERQIVTTDLRKDCTEYHTGTSASAPLAAGITALVLQANPSLTWRDMQHIVVETARPANLKGDDWVTNDVGRKVSHHFGFGLMDAGGMVAKALNWTNVPPQHRCEIRAAMPSRKVAPKSSVEVYLESNGCHGTSNEVLYLEHVQAVITLGASKRGQLQIYLTSPSGTKSTLLAQRGRDSSTEGFTDWAFMTTHNWGEVSIGRWTLEIVNSPSVNSVIRNWSLVLYGTATQPQAGKNVPHHPVNTPDCPGAQVYFNGKCQESCPPTFYAVNSTYTLPPNTTADKSLDGTSVDSPEGTTEHSLGSSNVEGNLGEEDVNKTVWAQTCSRCHVSCYECVGAAPNECMSCPTGYELQNNTCVYQLTKDVLDFIMSHKKGALIGVFMLIGVGALGVFLVTFLILQCKSYGGCPCGKRAKKREFVTKYRRSDHDKRISLGGSLRNGSPNPEFISQEEGLLTNPDRDNYEEDDEIFDDVIDYDQLNTDRRKRRKRRKIKHKKNRRDKILVVQVRGPDTVERKTSIQLFCNTTGRHRPPKSIKWEKDGHRFHSNPARGVMVTQRFEKTSLLSMISIDRALIRDGGEYACYASRRKYDKHKITILRGEDKAFKKAEAAAGDSYQGNRAYNRPPWYFRSSQRYVRW